MHTKGEWQTEFRNEIERRAVYVTSHEAGKVICRVFGNPSVTIQEGNARLIAAAPNSLKALQDIAIIEQGCKDRGVGYDADVHNIALDAIKKVEE